jgi:hypothetical protein
MLIKAGRIQRHDQLEKRRILLAQRTNFTSKNDLDIIPNINFEELVYEARQRLVNLFSSNVNPPPIGIRVGTRTYLRSKSNFTRPNIYNSFGSISRRSRDSI